MERGGNERLRSTSGHIPSMGGGYNYGDISKIDWSKVPDFDLFTMSPPCQDFSAAGLMRGGEEGSGTRSSLLWECRKAIIAKKPKYILFENVKNLLSKKFKPYFLKWLSELEEYGYINYYQIMNAADYGVPQHRERVFCISFLNDGCGQTFQFPKPFPLAKCLGDILEDKVEDKFYLTDKALAYFKRVDDDKTHNHNFTPKKKTTLLLPSDARQEAVSTTTSMRKSSISLVTRYKELLEDCKIEIDRDATHIIQKLQAYDGVV